MVKTSPCSKCGRLFSAKGNTSAKTRRKAHEAQCKSTPQQHAELLRQQYMSQPRDVRLEVFESLGYDDLPDGACWALAQEHGLEPADFIDRKK